MDAARSAGGGASPAPPVRPNPQAPPTDEEEDPFRTQLPIDSLIRGAYKSAVYLLSNYGWHVLFFLIVLAIVWTNIKPSLLRWLKKRQERKEEENFDPDKAERYQDGMMRAREKMQRELEEKARLYQEEEDEKAAKERDERIKQWEEFKVVTKSRTNSKPTGYSNPRDYFPLGGGGGGGGYRPQRRTLGGGGGG